MGYTDDLSSGDKKKTPADPDGCDAARGRGTGSRKGKEWWKSKTCNSPLKEGKTGLKIPPSSQ